MRCMWGQRAELAFNPKIQVTPSRSQVPPGIQTTSWLHSKVEEGLKNSKPYIFGASSWLRQKQKCCHDVY